MKNTRSKQIHKIFGFGIKLFFFRLFQLVKKPIFIFLTICGHFWIFLSAFLFYRQELSINPAVTTFLDAIYWSVSTVTTVGYGDIAPVTQTGRLIAIFTMIGGSVLFWTYTGLFASALLAPELQYLEDEVEDIESSIDRIKKDPAM